ncbi:MAG: hypothetical protein ACKVY0_29410 [Prosthecobacter sp.]|uniref:hypothetical protein n=1 Tax=Prosthecobacter sp. TaxID=1965333 RepID=UPI00390240E5
MANKVYIIARGLVAGTKNEKSGIDYVPGVTLPVTFWDYAFAGPNSDGGSVSAKEALTRYKGELQRLNAEWFMPFLERMSAGETVSLSEINARHMELFGTELQKRPSPYPPQYDDEGHLRPDAEPPART